jgi:2-polyprenyl-3-methyl-5-hydroxy-6-metoxy-1,4-benzoquinol methylase
MRCNICEQASGDDVEQAAVRSNVRKFAQEKFVVWRCPHCASLHARDEVDLAHYYAEYPFHKLQEVRKDAKADVMVRAIYRNLLSRLRAAGLRQDHALLDYGCGSGEFLAYLREQGFSDVSGYDEYSEKYADKRALSRSYDCVMSQDVIEHVPEPRAFVRQMHELTKPGGVIAIGTPNADAIDLKDPEPRVHALHQPYHRHILSKRMLQSVGTELGWQLLRYYPTGVANTLMPGANTAFLSHYFRLFDNNCDIVLDGFNAANWKLYTPVSLAHALFGYFWPSDADGMAVFRRG